MIERTYITLPKDVVLSLRESSDNIIKDMKKTVAVKYYIEKKLSLGQSADLAELNKEDFIAHLSQYKTSIFRFDGEQELLEDIDNA